MSETNGNGGGVAEQTEPIHFFRIITEEALQSVWPHCKKQIDKLRYKDKTIRTWTSHSVFGAIRYGLPTAQPRTSTVELWVGTQNKKIQGFMVSQPLVDPFQNNTQIGIYVWILDANFELLEKFLPEMDQMVRKIGGDTLEFHTGRLGWFRNWGRMHKLGFKIDQYRIRRTVPW